MGYNRLSYIKFKWANTVNLNTGKKDTTGKSLHYVRDTEPFDWYQRFSGLKEIITTNVDKDHKILNVGAGNSRLSE